MFGVRKEKPNGGSTIIRRSLINVHVNKQVVLLTAATRTTEVAELKRDLEQAQGELDLTKRQHEENKGK